MKKKNLVSLLMKQPLAIVLVCAPLFIFGCGGLVSSDSTTADGTTTDGATAGGTTTAASCDGTVVTALVGSWRILSETKYYDNSLPPSKVTPPSTLVKLEADGSWSFGSSSGKWCVASIIASDWTTWAITDYGATRKLILTNWNSDTEKGPIDEPTGVIDNLWIIYKSTGESGSGTIWMKLGASG